MFFSSWRIKFLYTVFRLNCVPMISETSQRWGLDICGLIWGGFLSLLTAIKKLQSELSKTPRSSFLDILILQLPVAQKTQVLHDAPRALWFHQVKLIPIPNVTCLNFNKVTFTYLCICSLAWLCPRAVTKDKGMSGNLKKNLERKQGHREGSPGKLMTSGAQTGCSCSWQPFLSDRTLFQPTPAGVITGILLPFSFWEPNGSWDGKLTLVHLLDFSIMCSQKNLHGRLYHCLWPSFQSLVALRAHYRKLSNLSGAHCSKAYIFC